MAGWISRRSGSRVSIGRKASDRTMVGKAQPLCLFASRTERHRSSSTMNRRPRKLTESRFMTGTGRQIPCILPLVGLHIGLDVLRRHQSHVVPLLAQSPPQKMRAAARFHADHFDLHIRGESQHLPAGTALADHQLPTRIPPYKMKHILGQIDTQRLKFHGMPTVPHSTTSRVLRRTIPLTGITK